MTTTDKSSSRSEKMKEVAFRRSIAKISPATLAKIVLDTIDNYERSHQLGKYTPTVQQSADNKEELPATNAEIMSRLRDTSRRLHGLIQGTQIEARKQKYLMVQFHLEAAARYLDKAMRQ